MTETVFDPEAFKIELISDRMVRFLGGVEVAGVEAIDLSPGTGLVHTVRAGLPVEVLPAIREALGVNATVFNRVIPRQTADAARQRQQRLSVLLSERILRLAKIYAVAEEAFGDPGRARAWLAEPNSAFEDMRPIEMMDTQQEAEQVEDTLVRMMYGVVA